MKPARFFLFAVLSIPFFQAAAHAAANQFIVVSDIHFNPLADPALASQLMAAEPSQWESIFAANPHDPPQHYNEDSGWPLFSSLIIKLQTIQPKPKLMVVTGDILPHKFQDKFASAGGSKDAALYRAFVHKTFAFVAIELKKASRGVPVILTLGNNDADCADYALEPNGPFLKDTAGPVQELAPADAQALTAWTTFGDYVIANPLAAHHRILALNTALWSRRYSNACADKSLPATDPGAEVLAWLSSQLQQAQRQGDKVWLVYHIPPGIDGHTSARTNQVTPFWKEADADGFNKLLDQYRSTIELNLAGHTHLDDFRLVKTPQAETLVLMTPGLSPNIGQNPAFRLITVDKHAHPQDLITYFMPDIASLKWQMEYSARTALGLKKIDLQDYVTLYRAIGESPATADKWKLFYSVSRPESLNSSKAYLRSLYCATGHTDPAEFQACLISQ